MDVKRKEVVMAAVQQNGNALEYATEEMKMDKDDPAKSIVLSL